MTRPLLLLLATIGCAKQASPPTTTPASPPPPPPPNFTYDAKAALDIRVVGEPDRWGDITISQITFASPRGGRVPALVVSPAERPPGARLAAIILQHGMGAVDKTNLLPDAVMLARAGAIALLPDAPDQRPAEMRTLEFSAHEHDPELWEQTAVDLRRAVDVLSARDDVDPQRIGFVGHSFGSTMGAILAAVEPRIRAFVLIAPGAYTVSVREGQTAGLVALRKTVPKRALDAYLATMEPLDAPRWLAKAPRTTNVLVQVAAYDPGVPKRAIDELVASSTATTELRRYPTGHFITSPSSMRDRLAFLGRLLQLPDAARALSRELEQTTTHDLVIRRVFDAPVDRVWTAWTSAEQVKRWWGPAGFTVPLARIDFRVGGTSLVSMRAPKSFGGMDLYNTWTYRRIEPRKQLEFILHFTDERGTKLDPAKLGLPAGIPAEVRHVITFHDVGGGRTEMIVNEYGYTTEQLLALSRAGMEQVLDKMAALFAGGP